MTLGHASSWTNRLEAVAHPVQSCPPEQCSRLCAGMTCDSGRLHVNVNADTPGSSRAFAGVPSAVYTRQCCVYCPAEDDDARHALPSTSTPSSASTTTPSSSACRKSCFHRHHGPEEEKGGSRQGRAPSKESSQGRGRGSICRGRRWRQWCRHRGMVRETW